MCFSDQSFGFAHFFDKTVQSNSVYLWFGWGKKKNQYIYMIESPRRGLPLLRAENNIGIYDI